MRLTITTLLLLALTACPPADDPDDTGGPIDPGQCLDVNEDGEPGHPGREFYLNEDGDDFGSEPVYLCNDPFDTRPSNYSPFDGDCDDNNDAIHPDADEMCDDIDNDCDGEIDVNALDAIQWHEDADGDGYGNPLNGPKQCDAAPGYVEDNTDCDDSSSQIFPGSDQGCE